MEEVEQYTEQETTNNAPFNELEASWLTIEPDWGKHATQGLISTLKRSQTTVKYIEMEDGTIKVLADNPWQLLNFYTRDLRFGNLSTSDYHECLFWLDFAGDCLDEGWGRSFMACLRRVITRVELSQSHKGFFRKRNQTVTREEVHEDRTQKAGMFSPKKKTGEY